MSSNGGHVMKISSQCVQYSTPETMEDNSMGHQNGGQMGQLGGQQPGANKPEEAGQRPQYSIPGILHFIQHEWARFELERAQWEVDKAELQARIAFLQGERKGQENLKNDLVRRIKMLEYALKQERAKYHKLKYGVDLQPAEAKPPGSLDETNDAGDAPSEGELPLSSVSPATWRQGRQLLRQYLQEIGYTDMIIDIRSNRVRSLLGLNNNAEQEENLNNGASVNGGESNKRANENPGRRTPAKKTQPNSMAEAMVMDAEAALLTNFDFLSNPDVVEMDDDDDLSDDADIEVPYSLTPQLRSGRRLPDEVDAEAEEVLNELDKLSKSDDDDLRNDPAGQAGRKFDMLYLKANEEGLGELAQLTVNNDEESSYDMSANSQEACRKTWNAKYTLRSHFDGVRAISFHPSEPVLITASEDHTLKLWNLQKTVPAKKSASLDVEPLYTFRAHTKPVLCLAISETGEKCYSGGLDGAIFCWNLPIANNDPYDSFEPKVLSASLEGHTDAVWGLAVNHQRSQLASCSADGTVKLWSPEAKAPLLSTFVSEPDGAPSSIDFVRHESNQIVVAYASAHCVIYDAETGKPVLRLESDQDAVISVAGKQINRVVCHPTLPQTITAHEDHHIRFWDNNTGKMVHSIMAHLDAVTSLAVDPNGLYLLSGSHDCSIRLWHFENKTCVQEITAHRKKFDEAILDVAFHPSRPYIASAGADAVAKVFV